LLSAARTTLGKQHVASALAAASRLAEHQSTVARGDDDALVASAQFLQRQADAAVGRCLARQLLVVLNDSDLASRDGARSAEKATGSAAC
jgi:hypothetical protein